MSAEYGTCGACRWLKTRAQVQFVDFGVCRALPKVEDRGIDEPACSLYSSVPDAKPPRPTETDSVETMAKSICALCSQDPDVAPTRKGYRWFVHAVESGGTINCEAGNVRELAHEKGE